MSARHFSPVSIDFVKASCILLTMAWRLSGYDSLTSDSIRLSFSAVSESPSSISFIDFMRSTQKR